MTYIPKHPLLLLILFKLQGNSFPELLPNVLKTQGNCLVADECIEGFELCHCSVRGRHFIRTQENLSSSSAYVREDTNELARSFLLGRMKAIDSSRRNYNAQYVHP